MCNFKSALLIPRFPSSDGFDIFHRDGVDSHTKLMELANINSNDKKINVAKLELTPNFFYGDQSDINEWQFILDEKRRPDWLDDSMLSDAEHELRQICSRYLTKDGDCTVLDTGDSKKWYLNGKPHREDGPAVEYPNGTKEWWINGERHRENGPAVEYPNGTKEWWINGERHRENGPAVEYESGTKHWYLNGEQHREDGPACEYSNGCKFWWINGESLTEQEFNLRKFSLLTNNSYNDHEY